MIMPHLQDDRRTHRRHHHQRHDLPTRHMVEPSHEAEPMQANEEFVWRQLAGQL